MLTARQYILILSRDCVDSDGGLRSSSKTPDAYRFLSDRDYWEDLIVVKRLRERFAFMIEYT